MFQMQTFLHLVNTKDPMVCHNLAFTHGLYSASIAHREIYNVEHPVYTLDPEKFISHFLDEEMPMSPRFSNVLLANWHAHGLKIGVGLEDTKWFPAVQIEKIKRIAEFEIKMEICRRKINDSLPSRLVSLFMAPDSSEGRLMLSEMFSMTTEKVLVRVKIKHKLRLHRADSKWLNEYAEHQTEEALLNYWRGEPFNQTPKFEYLLDGAFQLADLSDAEQFKKLIGRPHPLLKHGS